VEFLVLLEKTINSNTVEFRDLIAAPLILAFIILGAYLIRPYVTDKITRKYFFPALIVRIIGALAVGFIYQFYYSGGDTFNYHTVGSRIIWEAFWDSPINGIELFFHSTEPRLYSMASKIPFYSDPSSFAVIQLASFFDFFTFSSYSATAILFAVIGFTGSWMMFLTFYDLYSHMYKWFAWSIFFIPSVLFWGSGILKDTITFACVGFILYSAFMILIKKRFSAVNVMLLLVSMVVLYKVKIYILLTFLPAMILWVFFENLSKIKNRITRVFLAPVVMLVALGLAKTTPNTR
jgi:hypothetical protein